MLTYGPFQTMQREEKNNNTRNKYAMSNEKLAIYTQRSSNKSVQGYEIIEVDIGRGKVTRQQDR